jgi:precorrin-6B C5,15-methyltransferase / cobalt-precorrin-6B C5,C15-methyltransferase
MIERWLSIVGIGEDGIEGLSPAARTAIAEAALVVGGARHLELAFPLIRGESLRWPTPISDAYPTILAHRGRKVAVLASGDPFHYGIGATLVKLVPVSEMQCIPALSSFALACACLGWPMQDVATLSACGRPLEAVLPLLQPGRRILLLSEDERAPPALAALLCQYGFGESTLHVLESLGGPRERRLRFAANALVPTEIARLNLIGIEVVAAPEARVIPRAPGLPEAFFDHDGQITKREIRAISLAALAPRAGEMLWDIGCGSGSIACEWALAHPANLAIGIERDPERCERARRNACSLGVPGVRIVAGVAPDVLSDLPSPDAAFIGGGAHDPALIEEVWTALRPGGRLVANAVTIDTEARLIAAQRAHSGTLIRVGVERLDSIGSYAAFRPAINVMQWAVVKPWS